MPCMTATIHRLPDRLNIVANTKPMAKMAANIGTANEGVDQ